MARVAVRATLSGDKEMKRKLENIAGDKGMRKVARAATLEVGGEMVMRMKERTPVKKGHLRDSERILVMVSSKKEDIRISLVAGGPDVLYAAKVHETHPTKSKFMESVILETAPTAGQDIAARIDLRQAAGGA